jgi:hypothetical protein
VALNVAEKRCLLVGGGVVAQRKAASLLECGAHVSVIAPRLCDAFGPLRGQIEYSERTYHSGDCDRFQLVFACTIGAMSMPLSLTKHVSIISGVTSPTTRRAAIFTLWPLYDVGRFALAFQLVRPALFWRAM